MTDVGSIRYLFTSRVEERDGSYVVEIPEREIEDGTLEAGQESQIGVFAPPESDAATTIGTSETATETTESAHDDAPTQEEPTDGTGDEDGDDAAVDGDDGGAGEQTASRGASESGGAGATAMGELDEVELDEQEPPVSEGDTRRVEIEDEGEQGDGLARIDRGYIVFVPDTEPGDTVEIEITDAKENFGFGKIVE